MSLLNEVLQDLDARAAPSGRTPLQLAAATPTAALADDLDDAPRPDRVRMLVWTGVALVAMLAAFAFWADEPKPAETRVVQLPAGSVAGAVRAAVPEVFSAISAEPLSEPLDDPVESVLPATAPDEPQVVPTARPPAAGDSPVAPVVAIVAEPEPVVARAPVGPTVVEPAGPAMPADDTGFVPLRNAHPPATDIGPTGVARKTGVVKAPSMVSGLEEIRRQIGAGELAEAEHRLAAHLKDRPASREARELLVGLMLRGERHAAALRELEAGLGHHPDHEAFLLIRARLLAQAGETGRAISALERAGNRRAGRGFAVLQMLGALYQQEGRYAAAAEIYRELLTARPGSGPGWVGLAISLDALGDTDASEAYRRAVSLGGLPAAAESYARRRLAALENGDG